MSLVFDGDCGMPIYEYKCTASECGKIDEHLMRFSDPDPAGCTKCGSPVQKIVSQTSFALKGSGWYVTDYKGGGNAGAAKDSGDATQSEGGETAPKTDTDTKVSPSTSSGSEAASSPSPSPSAKTGDA